jgi:hypothetical protein
VESIEIEGKYIGAIIGPRKSDSRNAEGNRDYHQYQENDMGIIEIAGTDRARLKLL